MRYTIDGPDVAIHAYGLNTDPVFGTRYAVDVAVLIPLPEADSATIARFGQYAAEQWATPPEYACFGAETGAAVVKWNGWPLDLDDPKTYDSLYIGTLERQRIAGEYGSLGGVWIIKKHKVSA